MSEEVRKLERRVRDLEMKLDQYHEHLGYSLEHDRQFQLNATWGILGAMPFLSALAVAYGLPNLVGATGWIGTAVGAVGFLATLVFMHRYVETGKYGDFKKLSRMPEWPPSDPWG
jgi:hypothetical protein